MKYSLHTGQMLFHNYCEIFTLKSRLDEFMKEIGFPSKGDVGNLEFILKLEKLMDIVYDRDYEDINEIRKEYLDLGFSTEGLVLYEDGIVAEYNGVSLSIGINTLSDDSPDLDG